MRHQENVLPAMPNGADEREFFKLEKYPGRLLRVEPLVNGSVVDSLTYYKQQHALAKELGERYGIATPDFDLQIEDDGRGDVLLMLSAEEIEFLSLPELKMRGELPTGLFDDLDIFYSSMINSIADAYSEKRPFFADFSNDQWKYGRRVGQGEEHRIWLIDIGAGSFMFPGDDSHDMMAYHWAFDQVLDQLSEAMQECEGFFDRPSELSESWQALERAREVKQNSV